MADLPKGPDNRPWITKRKAFERQKSNQTFYNSTLWRKTRKAYIMQQPFCEECERNEILTDATGRKGVVDHIKRIEDGGSKFDFSNLQTLCNKCHNRKSGREGHEKRQQL
jgi:5-methylcytosine-specific restriction endonuclease McrA